MYKGPMVGAFILIAVGIIGLIANFDLIPRIMIDQLWKLWPVIPLAIGLDLLFRRRGFANRPPRSGT